MKKLLTVILSLSMIFALAACSSSNDNEAEEPQTSTGQEQTGEKTDGKVLVAYFSWSSSHNTKAMAEYVAEATGGELFEIKPETPYTEDYDAVLDQAQEEQDSNARPALLETLTQEQLDEYDTIFVGYPVWWYDAPMIIYTFMESLDFSNKTVVTFATSGGSGISDENLKEDVKANYLDGLCLSNFDAGEESENSVNEWVGQLGLGK